MRLPCMGLALMGLAACAASRVLAVDSEPPGAIVRLDEEIIGQTPLEYEFLHYGVRRITLYLAGYETWSQRVEIARPWHARFPVDIFTEVLFPIGTKDRHELSVELLPDEPSVAPPDIDALLERAYELRRSTPGEQPAEDAKAADEVESGRENGGGDGP